MRTKEYHFQAVEEYLINKLKQGLKPETIAKDYGFKTYVSFKKYLNRNGKTVKEYLQNIET